MKLVVIDGQSGRMGQVLIERVKAAGLPCEIIAVGANAIATSAMLKAGADAGATGEKPGGGKLPGRRRHCRSHRHYRRRFPAWRDHSRHGGGRGAKFRPEAAAACKPLQQRCRRYSVHESFQAYGRGGGAAAGHMRRGAVTLVASPPAKPELYIDFPAFLNRAMKARLPFKTANAFV